MKKKNRKLYLGFWLVTFIGFTAGLGLHLSNRGQKPSPPAPPTITGENALVSLSEQKEPSPEETRHLPDISKEEVAFRERTVEALRGFPRKDILKEKGRDLHTPPKELVEASQELGIIEDMLDKTPSLLSEGLKFYKECALSEELLTPLRALCLHNLKTRSKRAGVDGKVRWDLFPQNLHRIADKL
ncbi:MAG: hypothetical protein EB078_11020 [Proteobacteria bacterium]|nr:hypothetical protein [Pseudomonadota bacterium]NDC25634.1 hypothetical protein [Pseudomonadota bacterium]NDD05429.1 hypothetical protein [Pseudomonadota bacterium]